MLGLQHFQRLQRGLGQQRDLGQQDQLGCHDRRHRRRQEVNGRGTAFVKLLRSTSMPSYETEKQPIARNNRGEDKPTTPRLPKGAVWGTCLLMLALFLLTSIGYFRYHSLNSSAPSGNMAAALSADSPAQKPQTAPTPSHGILQRLRSVWVSTPQTTEPAVQNRPQPAEQQPAAAPSEAILQA